MQLYTLLLKMYCNAWGVLRKSNQIQLILKRNTSYYTIVKYQLALDTCIYLLFSIRSQKPIKMHSNYFAFTADTEYFNLQMPPNLFCPKVIYLTKAFRTNLRILKDQSIIFFFFGKKKDKIGSLQNTRMRVKYIITMLLTLLILSVYVRVAMLLSVYRQTE